MTSSNDQDQVDKSMSEPSTGKYGEWGAVVNLRVFVQARYKCSLRSHPELLNYKLHFHKISKGFMDTFKFESMA